MIYLIRDVVRLNQLRVLNSVLRIHGRILDYSRLTVRVRGLVLLVFLGMSEIVHGDLTLDLLDSIVAEACLWNLILLYSLFVGLRELRHEKQTASIK